VVPRGAWDSLRDFDAKGSDDVDTPARVLRPLESRAVGRSGGNPLLLLLLELLSELLLDTDDDSEEDDDDSNDPRPSGLRLCIHRPLVVHR